MSFSKKELNIVQDLGNGFFFTWLDFPSSKFLPRVLDESYKYVWVIKHFVKDMRSVDLIDLNPWFDLKVPLHSLGSCREVKVRDMDLSLDFIVETQDFLDILKDDFFHKSAGIRCIQMNILPPNYFSFDKFKGHTLFKELEKIEAKIFADFSGSDYGRLYSSDRSLLESILNDPSIDLVNLP